MTTAIDIHLMVVPNDIPAVSVNGKYFSLKDAALPGLRRKIILANNMLVQYNIGEIWAWEGAITSCTAHEPAKEVKDLVSFTDILLGEETYTRDHEVIQKIYFALGLLVWLKSSHFTYISGNLFRCVACGSIQHGTGLAERVPCADTHLPPNACSNDGCYSRTIEKILTQKNA
ncbi:MAG: hypothetical protein HYT94_05380 [Parcubacteria group bacterium]|nr:hypothetical protein [Parcubacteria group bacterium]